MKSGVKNFEEFILEKVNSEIKKDNKHAEVAIKSLDLRNQAHIFHWQTLSGTHHEALGEFYDNFLDKIDELIEYTMGKYGRFSVVGLNQTKLVDYDDDKCCDLLQNYHDYYQELKDGLYKNDDAMTAVLDEIMGDILKLKYILSMD